MRGMGRGEEGSERKGGRLGDEMWGRVGDRVWYGREW